MFRLTLAQMRRSIPRLVAAGLAIAIGTAFVAATLLAGGVMQRTGRDAVTARYADADVVVDGSSLSPADLAAVRAAPGVAAADAMVSSGVSLQSGSKHRWQLVLPTVADERLTPLRVVEGRAPSAPGEIALPQNAVESLGLTVGDSGLTAEWAAPDSTGTWTEGSETLTLVGVVSDPKGAWVEAGGTGMAAPDEVARWSGADSTLAVDGAQIVAAATPGTSAETLRDSIATAAPSASVLTRAEAADEQLRQLGTGGDAVLVSLVLGFAAIAMLVAALVIANTFQVLVAQRTRTLALLRAVGARRRQLQFSVLTEAAILGLASSVTGLVVGTALAQGMLTVLRNTVVEAPLPATITITWPVVAVPLVVGTAVTLLASLVPARAATRVTAIEALRPLDTPTAHRGGGAARLGFAIALTALGTVVLVGAVLLASNGEDRGMAPLGLGVLGGAVSFVGVLLGAVFWVPPVVRLVQRVLSPLGPVPRLAAANTVRNPRRTAATSTALLIGVTLVALMSTGAASARASMDRELDQHFPVDMTLTPTQWPPEQLAADLPGRVAAVPGVAHVAVLSSVDATTRHPDGSEETLTLRSITPEDAAAVLRDESGAGLLTDGSVLLPERFDAGGTIALQALDASGRPSGRETTLRAEHLSGLRYALVTPAAIAQLDPAAVPDSLFVSLDEGANAADVMQEVQDTLGDASLFVESPGAQRAQFDQVINVLLAIVIGLLGVAVLIALLGVTNTLSLSVIERRRESATLRAIGLSRRRLRATLAIEGMLIAGVGAVLGSALGLLYGWAGATTILGQLGDVALAVPWRDLALVVVVALAAGLVASVVPARSAVRTPPVVALADE